MLFDDFKVNEILNLFRADNSKLIFGLKCSIEIESAPRLISDLLFISMESMHFVRFGSGRRKIILIPKFGLKKNYAISIGMGFSPF